jgi:hypothetical protein
MSYARSVLARTPMWLAVVAVTAVYAVVGWSGIEQWRDSGGDDAFAYRDYVERVYRTHELPPRSENYEYSLPPGVPALGVAVTWAFEPIRADRPSPPLRVLPRHLRRLLWLVLVLGGGALLAGAQRSRRRLVLGTAIWIAAAIWAADYVGAAVNNERWLPLVLVPYTAALALVPATAWLAREVWPQLREAPFLGSLAAVAMPVVFMSTLYFHPDPPFALFAVIALTLAVRALRTGLTVGSGVAVGVMLGLCALSRQSAPVVALALILGVALVARRAAARFLVATVGALALVAGPWWAIQAHRFGNPILSNLNRPGYMLDHEPLSFFVSFPVKLVTHPYVPAFPNELLPRFHAYLWSDWGGQYHHWGETKAPATQLASVQSVLGFGGDALVLGGVALIGVPALLRVARRHAPSGFDGALAVLTTLFFLSWIAYVATLVRFPQRGGDPIKAHYLLFLAPVSAVFAIAAGRVLAQRGPVQRRLLYAWLAAYGVSWTLTLATAF